MLGAIGALGAVRGCRGVKGALGSWHAVWVLKGSRSIEASGALGCWGP